MIEPDNVSSVAHKVAKGMTNDEHPLLWMTIIRLGNVLFLEGGR